MTPEFVIGFARQSIELTLVIALPMLGVGLGVGVLVSVLQAATQIQEMTLTFVPKVGLMLAVFWVSMSFMTAILAGFFTDAVIPLIEGS